LQAIDTGELTVQVYSDRLGVNFGIIADALRPHLQPILAELIRERMEKVAFARQQLTEAEAAPAGNGGVVCNHE
jgi:hypothetical protein